MTFENSAREHRRGGISLPNRLNDGRGAGKTRPYNARALQLFKDHMAYATGQWRALPALS